eukprot:PRCOL_00002402-RA
MLALLTEEEAAEAARRNAGSRTPPKPGGGSAAAAYAAAASAGGGGGGASGGGGGGGGAEPAPGAPSAEGWAALDAMGSLSAVDAATQRADLESQLADLTKLADQSERGGPRDGRGAPRGFRARAATSARAAACPLSAALPTWDDDRRKREGDARRRMGDILKACLGVVRALLTHRWAWPFAKPVDAATLGLADYYKVITRPMDLGTVKTRLDKAIYTHPAQVLSDMRLVFENARAYNAPRSDVWVMAGTMAERLEERWEALVEPKLAEERARVRAEEEAEELAAALAKDRGEAAAAERRYAALARTLTAVDRALAGIRSEARFAAGARPSKEERAELKAALQALVPGGEDTVAALYSIAAEHQGPGSKLPIGSDNWLDVDALDAAALRRLQGAIAAAPSRAGERKRKAGDGAGGGDGAERPPKAPVVHRPFDLSFPTE